MNYVIDDKYLVKLNQASSKGAQTKYFRNGFWYKVNSSNNEDITERLAYLVLKNSTLCSKEYISYTRCTVNNKRASRSKSFISNEEQLITISGIFNIYNGAGNITNKLYGITNINNRINYVIDMVKEYTGGLDMSKYVEKIIYLDMLLLNVDRHFGNIAIKVTNDERFVIAPIFDNGQSLLGGMIGDITEYGIEQTTQRVHSKAFAGSFEAQVIAISNNKIKSPFKINYKALYNDIITEFSPNNTIVKVLIYQLKRYKDIFELN